MVDELLPEWPVVLAMRYGTPSIPAGLAQLEAQGCDHIVVCPLYPQYASSTTGSIVEAVYREVQERWNTPFISIVPPSMRTRPSWRRSRPSGDRCSTRSSLTTCCSRFTGSQSDICTRATPRGSTASRSTSAASAPSRAAASLGSSATGPSAWFRPGSLRVNSGSRPHSSASRSSPASGDRSG